MGLRPLCHQDGTFYRQLLEWCDCVDKIRPTPPLAVVEYPIRVRDEPVDITPDGDETAAPKPIPFSANIDFSAEAEQEVKGKGRRGRPHKTDLQPKAAQPKRGRGRPRKASGDVATPPPPKKARPDATGEGEKGVVIAPPPPKKAKTDFAAEGVSQPPKRGRGRPQSQRWTRGKARHLPACSCAPCQHQARAFP